MVLHGKSIPWFVSDTLAGDLEGLLDSCAAEGPPQGAQVGGVGGLCALTHCHAAAAHCCGAGKCHTAHVPTANCQLPTV